MTKYYHPTSVLVKPSNCLIIIVTVGGIVASKKVLLIMKKNDTLACRNALRRAGTDLPIELYGIVYQATTTSLDPGRRPIARGKDETSEEAIYRSSPQLEKLLRTEFRALIVGHKRFDSTQHEQEGKLFRYLPPKPAQIHSFVYQCSPIEVREFGQSFDFLNMLLSTRLPVSAEELAAASLRQISEVYPYPHAYLVAAGKELAIILSSDFNRLKAVLGRIRG